MAQFAEIEAQSALEQDQRDADADHRFEQFAESRFGVEQLEAEIAGNRPGDEPCGQHQHDGRPAGPPRNPLRTDTEDAHEGYDKCL